MEDRIPLPTDNIFKFYALFGLLLFVFACGSVLYINKTINDYNFQLHTQIATIQDIAKPTQGDLTKKADLEALLKASISDRKVEFYACVIMAGIGFALMLYGFTKWQTEIQPVQDEIAKLQLEKLKHEVKELTKHSAHHKSD
jgi:predicted cobalt transporter CbtA